LVKHQTVIQTSFVPSICHLFKPRFTGKPKKKLCPSMLLSTADVAWLNWEPEIQAAPEPKKLSILNPNLDEMIVFDPLAHHFGNSIGNPTWCHGSIWFITHQSLLGDVEK
jgi:hypothetical protein